MDIIGWMHELDDHKLLVEFAAGQSEAAFAALVEHYVNLVYSTALRFTSNPHHAEEITQAVFIILARKAGNLSPRVVLSGWLYQTTRLTAANFLKGEIRRQRREQEVYIQSTLNESHAATWNEIAPLLDEAMGKLSETDRNALVLRFFENKSTAEIALKLQLTEAATRKRLNRALEKLRAIFGRRGVSSTTAIIAGTISANYAQAAPVELAKTVTAAALANSATVSTSTLTLIKETLNIMAWTKAKTTMVIGIAAVLAIGTTTMIIQHQNQRGRLPSPSPITAGQTEFPKDSWHFAGYANPESAFMSCMWAVNNGDSKTLLQSVSPSEQERLKKGNTIISPQDRADYEKMTGYRIVDQQVISENKVILTVETAGQVQTIRFAVERTDGEWKLAGNVRK